MEHDTASIVSDSGYSYVYYVSQSMDRYPAERELTLNAYRLGDSAYTASLTSSVKNYTYVKVHCLNFWFTLTICADTRYVCCFGNNDEVRI